MFLVTEETIDAVAVAETVRHDEAGAVIVFEGVTRNHHEGRRVVRLEYEAYASMAQTHMQDIARRACSQWPDIRMAMVHRVGVVAIGEASVVIAVSAPHRDQAYAASRFAIDELKATVPIWKKEVYDDGSSWKANGEVTA
jgi:molybdopterin synthase catalytic subunit